MTVFFTSDTHFWHRAIIEYCKRPIPTYLSQDTVENMNRILIENWNSKIRKQDEVYFLGDFAFCGTTKRIEILDQLQGIKYLIRGNHDHTFKGKTAEYFQWIRDYYLLRVHDSYEDDEGVIQQFHQPIVLCHFPILSWDGMAHGSWHLHGHCHGSIDKTWNSTGLRMDVGVDTNNLLPYSYEDVKNRMALRTVTPGIDHHGKNKENYAKN